MIQHGLIHASEPIDRMDWHAGVGLSTMVWDDVLKYHLYTPQLDTVIDYGFTPQITLGLEQRGILLGYTSVHLKYYLLDAPNSIYLLGGMNATLFDISASKGIDAGIGYAWNHYELDVSVYPQRVLKDVDKRGYESFVYVTWRYKF